MNHFQSNLENYYLHFQQELSLQTSFELLTDVENVDKTSQLGSFQMIQNPVKKPFACPLCDYSASTPGHLKSHCWQKHGLKMTNTSLRWENGTYKVKL